MCIYKCLFLNHFTLGRQYIRDGIRYFIGNNIPLTYYGTKADVDEPNQIVRYKYNVCRRENNIWVVDTLSINNPVRRGEWGLVPEPSPQDEGFVLNPSMRLQRIINVEPDEEPQDGGGKKYKYRKYSKRKKHTKQRKSSKKRKYSKRRKSSKKRKYRR